MSSPKTSESELKAGHPPAVKAGGMRITQHKTPKEPAGLAEDTTGLKVSGSPPKTTTVAGVEMKSSNEGFPREAVQNITREKPPAIHGAGNSQHHIQQPRK